MNPLSYFYFAILLLFIGTGAKATALFNGHTFGQQSSVLVVAADSVKGDLFSWQADKLLVPASTMKLVTAQLAIEKWGVQHRFYTDFFLVDGWLWVKGYGDPFLVSEELVNVVESLKPLLAGQSLRGVAIDASYFDSAIVPGRTRTNDPYNAPLSAVAANFNTAFVRQHNGRVASAEVQTPLTPTARALSAGLVSGKHRINVKDALTGQRHFAEILQIMLKPHVAIDTDVQFKTLPLNATRLYRHYNPRNLADNLQGALQFSNNFIANQLFALLGENQVVPSRDMLSLSHTSELLPEGIYSISSGQRVTDRVGGFMAQWQGAVIEEGAGLSRRNRLSARQLVDTLIALEDYQYLLRSYEDGKVRAKTGTLKGVRTFAGYLTLSERRYYFVFLFNEPMPFKFRNVLLKEMIQYLQRNG